MRSGVLTALAPHDSRWTLELLAETRPTLATSRESSMDSELELETRLATIIAANDSAYAVEMARKSLAKGFSYNLTTLLATVQEKDPAAAAELASDILAKLKTVTLASNQEAATVAVKLFEMATIPGQPKSKPNTREQKPLLTEQSLREFAELLAAAVLDPSPASAVRFMNIRSVLPQIEKYAPSRAQQLRRALTESDGGTADGPQVFMPSEESQSAASLLAAAEKAEPGMRDNYYRQAVMKLVNDDKMEEARQVITTRISDPEQRKQMLAELDKRILSTAASKGQLEETRKLISSARTNEERIEILTQLATAVAEKGDKKTARLLLEEARNLSPGRTRYLKQLLARLQIARAYAFVDADQSLAILEPVIDQLNEIIAAGIILGEFFGEEEVVRDDEVLILFVGEMAGEFQKQFGKDLVKIATADFARTRDAAERFQRFEVRIMARLLVAQSVLKKDAKSEEPGSSYTERLTPVPPSSETNIPTGP